MTEHAQARLAFADFLTRLAAGDDAEWEQYIVQHYADDFLEEIRVCVMRLRHYSTAIWGAENTNNTLRHWGDVLRLSINAELPANDYSHVKLNMTASEFVVLDSILRRFSETDDFMINDAAERQTLYNLQCLCEKYDSHSLLPELPDAKRELSCE